MGWDVVVTMREPLPLAAAFVAHHLEAGARCVHVYLDAPNDPAAPLLARHPDVRLVLCDETHWRARGGRPPVHGWRQWDNATQAARHCRSDWLLHCDADEFLQKPRLLRKRLSDATDQHLCARLNIWERCFAQSVPAAVFGGMQRGPLRDTALLTQAYGTYAPLLRQGLTGHVAGKSLARAAAGLLISAHSVHFRNAVGRADKDRKVPGLTLKGAHLLHYDGLTVRHTRRKADLRLADSQRRGDNRNLRRARSEQMALMVADSDGADTHFAGLRTVRPEAIAALEERGKLRPIRIDPARAAIRTWPELIGAFDQAGFDRFARP